MGFLISNSLGRFHPTQATQYFYENGVTVEVIFRLPAPNINVLGRLDLSVRIILP